VDFEVGRMCGSDNSGGLSDAVTCSTGRVEPSATEESRGRQRKRKLQLNIRKLPSGALLVLLLATPVAQAGLLETSQPWSFMQSVGGIIVEKADRDEGGWRLPLLCDVSGLRTFTSKPTAVNSGLAWSGVTVAVEGRDILITVVTGPPQRAARSSACGEANLGRIPRGRYRLIYRDPSGDRHRIADLDLSN